MDRALKERVVGAVVLVVLAVLIVPVFLDGRSNGGGQKSEAILLPGQAADGSDRKTIVLERDRTRPVPAPRNAAEEAAQEARPEQAEPAPETDKTPPPEPVPVGKRSPAATDEAQPTLAASPTASSTGSSTGMWAVQLGSFSNQDNAERLAADLRKAGYAAFLSQMTSGSKQLHRVRIGPQKDRASADAVAAKLAQAGHRGQVVPHP